MIDKELKVGDCIYLPYSSLEDLAADMKRNGVSKCGIPNYTQFANDTDVNNNIYFCALEIAPWGTVSLREINHSHGMIYLENSFVKQNGKFVKHKELEVIEVCGSNNEVASRRVTILKDEAEDDERVNVLDAMAESKTKALIEDENQTKNIDDKIDKVIDARLSASEEKIKADIENLNAIRGELAKKQDEKVSHPSHYTWLKELCGIEVIDIARHLDFDMGNALKYLLRAGKKSEEGYSDKEKEIEDLKKAVFYIQDKIKMLEEEDERD